jgi:hypothetical protein
MLPNAWNCQVFPTANNYTQTDSFTGTISTSAGGRQGTLRSANPTGTSHVVRIKGLPG